MIRKKGSMWFWFVLVGLILTANQAFASEGGVGHQVPQTFLWMVIIIIAAKLSGIVEKIGQPPVLGELLIGVLLGNLYLLGIDFFEPAKDDAIIIFLAEIGVVLLLFQTGLESKIDEMRKVGVRALAVAMVGVILPMVLGTYVVGPWLLPGLSFNAYLFLGATLTATSVGITARVFKDLKTIQTPEARIVLGAAVIDDVLGLIILAVVSALVTMGTVSTGSVIIIIVKAVGFLAGAVILGQLITPFLGRFLAKVNTGHAMKFAFAICFCLLLAYLSGLMGLAPIVGAFAAGLVLEPVHFKGFKDPMIVEEIVEATAESDSETKKKVAHVIEQHSEGHIEELIEPNAFFLTPIFFVMTGAQVRVDVLFDGSILLVALGISVFAILSKVVAGLVAGPVRKWVVGWGMVPRGEVGLIFAAVGKALGVVSNEVFSVIIIMVIVTTLITPPILTHLLSKKTAS